MCVHLYSTLEYLALLRDFLQYAKAKEDVWIATGAEIAAHFEASELATERSVV